jgi:hypothetical protein
MGTEAFIFHNQFKNVILLVPMFDTVIPQDFEKESCAVPPASCSQRVNLHIEVLYFDQIPTQLMFYIIA